MENRRCAVCGAPFWTYSDKDTCSGSCARSLEVRETDRRVPKYDESEQGVILRVFSAMLSDVTKDGGRKRLKGEKPPWWKDGSHEAAIFSHLNKWKHGEKTDPDSGAHPFVHLAWRALAIAYQETQGLVDPAK